jgi:hypothetical protein
MLFFGGFRLFWGRGLTTLLLFLYVTEEAGRKCVWDMPWPLAAECNMITNKQNLNVVSSDEFSRCSSILIESRVLCRRFRLEMTHVPLEVTIVSCTLDNRW